jgi:glycosyltransferase 2 family protein
MSRRTWAWARLLGGAAILAVIVWRLGTGPIVDGIRTVSVGSVAAALVITAVSTAAAAYRWSLVASGLGVGVRLRPAIAAYYRAQFLNTALPGGVLGDAHRAVRHGREVGDVGRAARAVVWERCAGQVVQGALALLVLLLAPSPLQHDMPIVATVVVAAVVAAVALVAVGTRAFRLFRIIRADVRDALWADRRWFGVATSSVLVVAGHIATFLIAARAAGADVSLIRLLPLAMLVLLAMAVPTNIGGWGPREGVAAWAFSAAGLGAAHGVAVATAYGVLVFLASLPGAVVLVVDRRRREAAPAEAPERVPVGAAHG